MFTWVSAFDGLIATRLLSDLKFINNRYLPSFHRALSKRTQLLDKFLSVNLITYVAPDAAFFVFIDLSSWLCEVEGTNDKEREVALSEYLMDHGVFLEPGQVFSSKVPGHYRLSYGSEVAVLKLGLKRLAFALNKLDGGDKELVKKRAKTSRKLLSCFRS